jgi:hypothetical protein
MDDIAQIKCNLQAPRSSHLTIGRFLDGSGVGCGIECWHLTDGSIARGRSVSRDETSPLSTRSLLSTLVDCADDLFTLETEINPFDVER